MNVTKSSRAKCAVEDWNGSEIEDPPFHMDRVHPSILKYYYRLFEKDETGTVFVPLCGKSLDMIFFSCKGHSVVGVDFSEIAIETFFEENNLMYTKKLLENVPFTVYKTNEMDITIYKGDFFEISKDICGQFDVFWDRRSFVAIDIEDREAYTDILIPMMKHNSRYLIETLIFDGSQYTSAPHFVTHHALNEAFGRKCAIELLESKSEPAKTHIEMPFSTWTINIHLMRPKKTS